MEFVNNSIIICDESVKRNILKRSFDEKKLFNYTFLSLNEFKNRYLFKISDEAVIFSMEYLALSYENSKKVIQDIYLIDENTLYKEDKLNKLKELKKELLSRKLLEIDELFLHFIKDKNIYLIDCILDNFEEKLFKKIGNVTKINSEVLQKHFEICEFDNYLDEVDFVFSEISLKLNEGMDINKIVILCDDSSYLHMLNRFSCLYNIPIYQKEKESIHNHKDVKKFLGLIASGVSKEEAFDMIKEKANEYIYKQLITLVNRFYFINDSKVLLEVLEAEIKNIKYEDVIVEDAVKVVPFNHRVQDDEIAYLIGFNDQTIPVRHRDDQYLSDKFSNEILLTTSIKKNQNECKKSLRLIKNINTLYISYSKFTPKENAVSSLVEVLDVTYVKKCAPAGISKYRDKVMLGMWLDEFYNYSLVDKELDNVLSSIPNSYKKYDNKFSGVDTDLVSEKLDNSISLSYSSISTFYKCQFSYYLEKVLKVKLDTDTQETKLGTMFHEILQKYGTADFDLEKAKEAQLENVTDQSLRFYFNKLWPDFLLAIEAIDEFREDTLLKSEKHEEKVVVEYSDGKYQNTFLGFIDKLIYSSIDGTDYAAIIDYKTGSIAASLENIEHGFNLQLPVYAYLLIKSKLLNNPKILGFYLQHIVNKPTYEKDKEALVSKKNLLKLDGYSTSNVSDLKLLDYTYQKSKYIKSMATKATGDFYSSAKVLDEEEILNIVKIVENLIIEAFSKIQNGEFSINPKTFKHKDISCQFCLYKDICYKNVKDSVELENKGGE